MFDTNFIFQANRQKASQTFSLIYALKNKTWRLYTHKNFFTENFQLSCQTLKLQNHFQMLLKQAKVCHWKVVFPFRREKRRDDKITKLCNLIKHHFYGKQTKKLDTHQTIENRACNILHVMQEKWCVANHYHTIISIAYCGTKFT